MRARFEVATRHAVACLSLVVIAVAGGCGGGGSGSPSGLAFTKGALKSLPLVRPPAPTSSARQEVARSLSTPTSIDTDGFTAQLFKMECREAAGNQGVDYCPAGTPPQTDYGTALGSDPYAFDMQSLMGFIYAAQRETWLVTSCSASGLTPKTVTASSYFAHASTGADPTRFLFDQYATYACRSSQVADPSAETVMVSAAADGSYQTALHTRYKYAAGGETQTDVTQVDVSMSSGSPEFVALNFASAEPLSSRLVLLVNLTNHRFAMKYYTPQQPGNIPDQPAPERFAVTAGIGGYDLTSGNPNVGEYYIHFLDDPGEFFECVNNVGGAFEPDFTSCDADLDHTAWTPGAVESFLDVPAATVDRIGPYLAVFGDTADLALADSWTATTSQSADADLYWPAGLY